MRLTTINTILFATVWWIGFASALSVVAEAKAEPPKRLVFAVNSPGAAPYLYLDTDSNQYVGLVVDFFNTMADGNQLYVEYIDANRTRSEQFIYTGKADVFLSSLVWLKKPNLVISSEELSPNASFLYSTEPFEDNFSLTTLSNERICTRRAYVYPALTERFTQSVQRVDSSSQKTGLQMLLKARCDYLVMNQYNAISLFNTQEFCHLKFHRSPQPISSVPNALIFSKQNAAIVPIVNDYLRRFKQSGERDVSLSKHMKRFDRDCEKPPQ